MKNKDLQIELVYLPGSSCVFKKAKDEFGGLSNMSNQFKVRVNGLLIHNTEALYQACRFPHHIEVQRDILHERSPMAAKMKSKPYRKQHSRPDWEEIKIDVMRWVLRVKLAQNSVGFGELLKKTGGRPIVEHSHKDRFWGTLLDIDGCLKGQNVLGKFVMELRNEYEIGIGNARDSLKYVAPPEIDNFLLLGEKVLPVGRNLLLAA